jgi:hypothetical protein
MLHPILAANPVSVSEEENYFSNVKNTNDAYQVKLNFDIQPGQAVFISPNTGLMDYAWTDLINPSGKNKLLYLMATLTYHSEDLPKNEKIVTETCLIFEHGDMKQWHYCASGHNTTYKDDAR